MPGPTAPSARTLPLSQETLEFSVCFPMRVRGLPAPPNRDRLSESRMAGVKFPEVSVPSFPHPRRVTHLFALTRPDSKVVAWVCPHSHAPSSGPLTHLGWAGHVFRNPLGYATPFPRPIRISRSSQLRRFPPYALESSSTLSSHFASHPTTNKPTITLVQTPHSGKYALFICSYIFALYAHCYAQFIYHLLVWSFK